MSDLHVVELRFAPLWRFCVDLDWVEMIVPMFNALLEGWSNEGVDQRPAKRVATVLAQAA